MASSCASARLAKEPRRDNVQAGKALLPADNLGHETVTLWRDCSLGEAVISAAPTARQLTTPSGQREPRMRVCPGDPRDSEGRSRPAFGCVALVGRSAGASCSRKVGLPTRSLPAPVHSGRVDVVRKPRGRPETLGRMPGSPCLTSRLSAFETQLRRLAVVRLVIGRFRDDLSDVG